MNAFNEENYEYLIGTVFPRFGISGVMDDQLRAKMEKGGEAINIQVSGNFGKDTMCYDFKLDRINDRYYVNEVSTRLNVEDHVSKQNTFKLYNQKGYSADEMYEMMKEHFVYREFINPEGEKVGRWSTVNISKVNEDGVAEGIMKSYYDSNTRYNLIMELGKLPLVGVMPSDKERIVTEMRSGVPAVVNIRMPDGNKERVTLQAQPHIGGIGIYNKEGIKISLDNEKFSMTTSQKFKVQENNNSLQALSTLNAAAQHNDLKQGQSKGKKAI